MANSPDSAGSNHENGVGATSLALSSNSVSDATISELLHPTINEALSISGGESGNGVGQLGLNQRVNELRTRSLHTATTTTTTRVWDHGRADFLSFRNDHSAWLGAEFNDHKDLLRAQLLHPALQVNGVIFTSCKNLHEDKNAREKLMRYDPHASSSSPSSKEWGGDTMTAAANQLRHASSIRDRFMSLRYDGFNFEDPILRNGRSLSIRRLRMDHYSSFTNTHFHNILNYPTLMGGDTTPTHSSSSQTQPSHKRHIIIDVDLHEPSNTARGKKTLASSSLRNFPIGTSGPSIENCFQKIDLAGGIMANQPDRNISHRADPNQVDMDGSDDDGDNESYDGRIHSLPYKRNGPYTCPKCKGVFPTSQHFAAHASASHYKYETKAQRMKRQMAKIRRRRTLKLEQVKDGLTFIPVSSEEAAAPAAGAGNSSTERLGNGGGAGTASKVKVEGDLIQGHDPDAPPGFGGGKIKVEPSA